MKHHAFTLAETLITLAIIGIVAAITMPSMIANYQKKVYVNRLQKSYSLWSNTFKKMLADEGVTSLSDTSAFKSIQGNGCKYLKSYSENCNDFYNELSKYIKFTPKELTTDYPSSTFDDSSDILGYGRTQSVLIVADGSMLADFAFYKNALSNDLTCEQIKERGSKLCYIQATFQIDVNGLKRPNKMGRDVFSFYLSDDGNLYPYGGKDVAIRVHADNLTWDTYHSYCGLPKGDGPINGNGCAGRVMAEGWKMNY